MSSRDIAVTGLDKLQNFIDTLPLKIERNVLRGALRNGIKVPYAAAKQNCPVGPPSATGARLYKLYEGALRDSIRITTKSKGGTVTASVIAGGRNKKNGASVWYGHLIEFTGARAHEIHAKDQGALLVGGLFLHDVNHPGMVAKPFMRPALDTNASAAVVAAAEYMKHRLATKEGLDTADIDIDADDKGFA